MGVSLRKKPKFIIGRTGIAAVLFSFIMPYGNN